MIAVLEFYVSGFWTWLGLTIGLSVVSGGFLRSMAFAIMSLRGDK